MNINPNEFVMSPIQTVVGYLPAGADLELVQEALEGLGLEQDQFAFFTGEKGLAILNASGDPQL
ncbi:MAG: hypothetical protein ACRDIU_08695 [Actinomycetota bacterium]